ncbi:hypothetical protein COU58_01090 [Candidatus Pacearchaeota archaeon CG10_big_fil_rev_8_21_14_0_10_32_42]|nr:MAG: hypothetical protein COU58_01090 [Candidatus Pacearchaeota archaeon CG10_big_fil_rev_8_21_14_0_10_32_42]
MLEIYLVRHGEEEKVKNNNIEYQTDNSNLTENGIKQVMKLTLKLKNFKIDKIYSSNLKGTLQTAEIISNEIGIKINVDERIRERNMGDFEKFGDNWRSEFRKLKEKKLAEGVPLKNIKPPNGESLHEFRERIKSFMEDLSKMNGIILIIAHKGSNTAMINFVEDWNTKEFKSVEQNYTCMNRLVFENNKWKILEINNISHLK